MSNLRFLPIALLAASLFTTNAFASRPPPHQARASQGKRHHAKHHPKAAAPRKHAHSRHKKAGNGV